MKTETAKEPRFIKLPNGELVRPRLINRVIPCDNTQHDEGFSIKPTMKLLLQGKQKISIRFESIEKRDAEIDKLFSILQ